MISKRGILYTCYLGMDNAKDKSVNIAPKDAIKYLIVRRPVVIPNGFIHKPELSPSIELFSDCFNRWKKKDFNEEEKKFLIEIGTWDFKDYATYIWWDLYEPRFLAEIKEMEEPLKEICNLLDEGKDVCIYCYCKDLQFCHRRLVGEEIQKRGYEVIFR